MVVLKVYIEFDTDDRNAASGMIDRLLNNNYTDSRVEKYCSYEECPEPSCRKYLKDQYNTEKAESVIHES